MKVEFDDIRGIRVINLVDNPDLFDEIFEKAIKYNPDTNDVVRFARQQSSQFHVNHNVVYKSEGLTSDKNS